MRPVKQETDQILSKETEKKLRFIQQRLYKAGPKASTVSDFMET